MLAIFKYSPWSIGIIFWMTNDAVSGVLKIKSWKLDLAMCCPWMSKGMLWSVTGIAGEGAAWFCTESSCLLPDYSSYWTVETLQPESHTLQSHKVAARTEHLDCSFTDLKACFESPTLHVFLLRVRSYQ